MTLTIDRRAARRLHHVEDHGIVNARVRPGHRAHLVDVSSSGAMIETSYRLLPGTAVELHLETESTHTRIRGRVLRCNVARVRASAICYRGAIAFDRDLPWYVEESGAAPNNHDMRPMHPHRALVTREVL
jgi:hypothetical protein